MVTGVWFLTLRNPSAVSSFSAVSGGGDVDRRLLLLGDPSSVSTPDQPWVVEMRLKELLKSFPDPFSFLTFAGYRISLVD